MKRYKRLWFVIALLSTLFVGVSHAAPELVVEIGFDFWNYSELDRQIREADVKAARLSEQTEIVRRRVSLRDSILDDLFNGQIQPKDVLESFQKLNEENPGVYSLLALKANSPDKRIMTCVQIQEYLKNSRGTESDAMKYLPAFKQIEMELRQSNQTALK